MYLKSFKKVLGLVVTVSCVMNSCLLYALDDSVVAASMTGPELYALIQQADPQNSLKMAVTPEVLAKLNQLRFDEKSRAAMHQKMLRLDTHKAAVQTALKNKALPNDLVVLKLLKENFHASNANLNHLQNLYKEYSDWKLALIAYEFGEKTTDNLITAVGSQDPWYLARSDKAPKDLINYLAMLDASIIIMHNPVLIAGS